MGRDMATAHCKPGLEERSSSYNNSKMVLALTMLENGSGVPTFVAKVRG